MVAVIFSNYPLQQINVKELSKGTSEHTPLEYALYESLGRVGWSIALCYIIFACVHGYGGPVNWFLSLPLWQPLSRLSYAMYILHGSVQTILSLSMKQPPYFSQMEAVSFKKHFLYKFNSQYS